MQDARTGNRRVGKEIYSLQKSGKIKLSYQQWNEIWETYDAAKRMNKINRRRKIEATPTPASLVSKPKAHHAETAHAETAQLTPQQEFVPDALYVDDFEKLRREHQRPKRMRLVNPLSERAIKAKAMLNSQRSFTQTGVFCTHCDKDACKKGCFGLVPKLIPGMMRIPSKM